MKHGSLFSGIGGFDLAAEWVGWENVFQVEWDDWCQKVLTKNFPDVKKYKDIKDFNGAEWQGRVDVISGGFPCQPFSQAGKRQGKADNRYLWPEMLRVISEIKPTFVVGENVAGILSMENGRTLERILFDLEDEGYQVEVFVIPACAVGAWHRRDRVWIIANSGLFGSEERQEQTTRVEQCGEEDVANTNNARSRLGLRTDGNGSEKDQRRERQPQSEFSEGGQNVPSTNNQRLQRRDSGELQKCRKQRIAGTGNPQYNGSIWQSESGVGGMVARLSYWLDEPSGVPRVAVGVKDRVNRLKGLGNAIVPQVAYELFKTIENVEFY